MTVLTETGYPDKFHAGSQADMMPRRGQHKPVICGGQAVIAALLVVVVCLALPAGAEGTPMKRDLRLVLDGEPSSLAAIAVGECVLVPADGFADAVGAEVKRLTPDGLLTFCLGDLCIPLDGEAEKVEGTLHVPLATIAEPLGLRWSVSGGSLVVRRTEAGGQAVGFGVGDVAPDVRLPELLSGNLVSLSDYRGRKAVFYAWASW